MSNDPVQRAPAAGVGAGVLPRCVGWAAAPLAAAAIAVFVAAPWLDQGLVWCGWIGVSAALLLVMQIRGWWGEAWTLVGAATALTIAFHWTPEVLAYAMNTGYPGGLLFAAPIVLWDAVRLALPFWFAARVTNDPLAAWWPAGLAAAATEAFMPAVFPWKLGYSQIAWPFLVQSADLFGAEFSTLVFFAHAGAIAWLVAVLTGRDRLGRTAASRSGIVAVVLCVANAAYGLGAMASWSRTMETAPRLRIAVAQANPEDEGGVDELRSLTQRVCADPGRVPDLVCWPECSGGSYEASLDSLADPERVVASSREPNRGMRPLDDPTCPLLFGGKIYTGHPEKPRVLHQSAILVDASQAILGRYHKRHLMPFGEYVPGSDIYPDLRLYFPMQDEMTEGTEPTVLHASPAARLGVMLCYEDMIPAAARSLVRESANVLVSLINGSAFTAPLTLRQHRLLAQLRAVECRRALVRCAATGETCVISPLGVITAELPLHTRDILVADVPLLEGRTLAGLLGPAFPIVAAAGVLAIVALRQKASRRPRGSHRGDAVPK
ncbi:MAG: apolipoprotein N-acyltransferase [Planctomycetia bacterium]|nr:apolipoprotein N-acyltransferase [Planctomycetia bacterium]